ncbi:hypothetical protein OIU84_014088 [Salix udensis]|uniref:Glyoxalase I n=1 Tax=Salix udensis TaxID=889485 RepID=A0AAD6JD70_9ROSI|nr:hypothetical protein OIU84_014088 [Salix udensis]
MVFQLIAFYSPPTLHSPLSTLPSTLPFLNYGMAEEAAKAVTPNAELLEWPKKDKRRLLHAVYRVGDLDRTIKFYTEGFGMKLLRHRDIPEEKYTNAFLGFGPEESNFVVELTYNYGVTSYDIGEGFGHFGIATEDVYKLVEKLRALGGNITREPGPVKGGASVIAFVKDPDGYTFELIQRGPTPEPLCQLMLRVGDLDRSIKFYEKALGMKLLRKIDRPEYKYTLAMVGYADEYQTIVLELTYNYGVTEYTKGNAYAQIAVSTDDVYKSAEVVNHVTQELGGKITRQPGLIPGINTKITSFLDPDGWKTVLVDNAASSYPSTGCMVLMMLYKTSQVVNLVMQEVGGKMSAAKRIHCGTPLSRKTSTTRAMVSTVTFRRRGKRLIALMATASDWSEVSRKSKAGTNWFCKLYIKTHGFQREPTFVHKGFQENNVLVKL